MRLKEIGRFGVPGETGVNLSGMEVRAWSKDGAIARGLHACRSSAASRRTKLNERELGELEGCGEAPATAGELSWPDPPGRDRARTAGVKASAGVGEIKRSAAMVNLLRPAATGQPMPVKTLRRLHTETNKRKAR